MSAPIRDCCAACALMSVSPQRAASPLPGTSDSAVLQNSCQRTPASQAASWQRNAACPPLSPASERQPGARAALSSPTGNSIPALCDPSGFGAQRMKAAHRREAVGGGTIPSLLRESQKALRQAGKTQGVKGRPYGRARKNSLPCSGASRPETVIRRRTRHKTPGLRIHAHRSIPASRTFERIF